MKKENILNFLKSILNSYSQVFFSDNKVFAGILLLVSFFDLWAGFSGLLAIVISNLLGYALGYSTLSVNKGAYGFNSLLVGLGTGLYFQPGFELLLIILVLSILTFFITIALEGILGKYGLPYISIPFLFGMWTMALASSDLSFLGVSERGLYLANDMYLLGGTTLLNMYYWWNELELIFSLKVYLLSLGAIFFQFNTVSGILIAIGLLIYSRIAFSLSLIGFYAAFYFYMLIGADITELSYTYIGFNFILTSIALGGFFIVPSRSSYLWVILLLPVVVLLTISFGKIFEVFRLPVYSLPFNVVVLVFLYSLKLRFSKRNDLVEIMVQHNSPERNLYFFKNASQRFKELEYLSFRLPFYGQWTVSQAHNGSFTHTGDWRHAWDFILKDEDGSQYKDKGEKPDDYYCYGKKVIASADGIVQEVVDGIMDNPVGDMDIGRNWGNTVILKHAENVYSKYSHLKAGSIQVTRGASIRKGEVLGQVGNSGRSPYPHLHFQFQATPFVGSATMDYPFSYFIHHNKNLLELRSFDKPKQDDLLSNIDQNPLLKKAFHFIPGQKLSFVTEEYGANKSIHWEVKADSYNNAYIHCSETNSFAYFYNDGVMHYFKNFVGDRQSFLFTFYTALFRVQTGYYQDLEVRDNVPVNQTFGGVRLFFQDFVAPFWFYLQTQYSIRYESLDDALSPSSITLRSNITNSSFSKVLETKEFVIIISKAGIQKLEYTDDDNQQHVWTSS